MNSLQAGPIGLKKAKWLFVLSLVLWLAALTVTYGTLMVVYSITAANSLSTTVDTRLRVAQVIIRVASVWMVLGWIPVLLALLAIGKGRVHK